MSHVEGLVKVLAACVVVAVLALPIFAVPPRQLVPNPSFLSGLTGWSAYNPAAAVTVVAVTAGPAPRAAQIDARPTLTEAGLESAAFPAAGPARYRLGGWVQRLAGEGSYKISVEWLDAERRHLSYDNSWTGVLLGDDWQRHQVEVTSPPATRFARILAGVGGMTAARMTAFELSPLKAASPTLAIDLLADPLPGCVTIRLENRQPVLARGVRVTLALPPGLHAAGPLTLTAGDLAFEQSWQQALALTGRPADPEQPIRCTVTADFAGKRRTMTAATRPFVTVAREVETATGALRGPVKPSIGWETRSPSPTFAKATAGEPDRLLLGAYYFPVMLDWDRNNWGVRRVPYLTPRLGYYDEARPEVADWHITWAVEHGLSFFVFDWYYNQGMTYLNDALEQGFLKSRIADRMQWCIDWCNEGQCQEFKPLDFSDESLAGFMTYLCDRYFVRQNYLRVEGKPVVFIHQAVRIANAHGGWAGCRQALEKMRAIARRRGHPGVYFVSVQSTPWLLDWAKGGFDATTAYTYGFCDLAWGGPDRAVPYPALLPRTRERWEIARRRAHEQGLDYIPTAWVGWDDNARAHEQSVRTAGNTPAAFRRMVEELPAYADRRPGLALVEAWNEWGEGSVLEPGGRYGFGYASALRDALTTARGPYTVPVPSKAEVAAFDTPVTMDQVNERYYRRYARSLGLDRGLAIEFGSTREVGLLPWGYLANVRLADGRLRATVTGEDPMFAGPPTMGLPAARVRSVRVRMSATAGTEGQLFWSPTPWGEWSEERSAKFPLVADGQMHEYTIDLAAHPQWHGTIERFRFDPTDAPGEIALDWLRTE